jgi:hypothetical protein
MPKPLAKQVVRRVAMDMAMDMVDAIENSGAEPSSPTANLDVVMNDANYFLSSIPIANFFVQYLENHWRWMTTDLLYWHKALVQKTL